MTIDELDRLFHEVDKLYSAQSFRVTQSILDQVKLALAEMIEMKRQNGDART